MMRQLMLARLQLRRLLSDNFDFFIGSALGIDGETPQSNFNPAGENR